MIHEILPVGALACNCSILGDESTHKATVIDPGDDIADIVCLLEKHQLTVEQIIVTHAHIDHVGGAVRLKKLTGAPIYMNQHDLPLLKMMDTQAGWLGIATPEVQSPDVSADDGLQLIAAGQTAHVLHTPGHTQGSICLHLPEQHLLLAGDTLFAGSIGRTDLPGGDLRSILQSLHNRVMLLPDETRVIPGHGSATTIGHERETNPFLVRST
ncbi:MAG TPA: MBL fold metallo-hydrolase [Acidobacteriaceae bacterium]|jgi:glyoxylase-like metal-dependent hydrolase (beta-lactamase superfamily II)|nr:MBL fold metallo-hydrolase [Acidobacteriaceae bacterium]